MMTTLFTFMCISCLVATVLGEKCYDATGEEFENGRLNCRLDIQPLYDNYNSYIYICDKACIPGFKPNFGHVECRGHPIRPGRGQLFHFKEEFEGRWTFPRSEMNCTAPTYCPKMHRFHPKNGKSKCQLEESSGVATCSMSCDFPYGEPEIPKEYCSNETQFFWTHVLRNNKTEFPPCKVKKNCDDIETTVVRNNGSFKCNNLGLSSKTCKLQCDYGYILTKGNPSAVCGPPTGFRWSHEWTKYKQEVGELAKCEKAPITVELSVFMRCSDSRKVLDLIGSYLEEESSINARNSFPMWEKQSYQVKCDANIAKAQMVRYYFNYKDVCTFGTCLDLCYYLNLTSTNLQQCKEVCDLPMANSLEMLNEQRSHILSFIAKFKGDEEKLKSLLRLNGYGWQSMNVFIEKSNYIGDVKGPSSPFCGVTVDE